MALAVQKGFTWFTSKTAYLLKLKKSDVLSTFLKKGTTKNNWPPTNTYLLQQHCQISAPSQTQWLIFIAASLLLSPSFIGTIALAKTSLLSCRLSPPLPDRELYGCCSRKKRPCSALVKNTSPLHHLIILLNENKRPNFASHYSLLDRISVSPCTSCYGDFGLVVLREEGSILCF